MRLLLPNWSKRRVSSSLGDVWVFVVVAGIELLVLTGATFDSEVKFMLILLRWPRCLPVVMVYGLPF